MTHTERGQHRGEPADLVVTTTYKFFKHDLSDHWSPAIRGEFEALQANLLKAKAKAAQQAAARRTFAKKVRQVYNNKTKVDKKADAMFQKHRDLFTDSDDDNNNAPVA